MTIPNVGGHFSLKVLQNGTPTTQIHRKRTQVSATTSDKPVLKNKRVNLKEKTPSSCRAANGPLIFDNQSQERRYLHQVEPLPALATLSANGKASTPEMPK